MKHRFPKELTPAFLLVDLVNTLDELAEDPKEILANVQRKAKIMGYKKAGARYFQHIIRVLMDETRLIADGR